MINKRQIKSIEDNLSRILQRIERIEDKEALSDKDIQRLDQCRDELAGADQILTVLGFAREYHAGTIDASGKIHGSTYTLIAI